MKAQEAPGQAEPFDEEDSYSSDVQMLASDEVYEEESEETEKSTETEDEARPQHKK